MDTAAAPHVPALPSAAAGNEDAALDGLLELIITGHFVLTDGQGALSKWSDPAEFLFDLPAEEALGQPFFGRLVDPGSLDAVGSAWRAFLELGEVPGDRGRAEMQANRPGGGTFPMEAVFVPVKLDEGFDFSLFLEDLSFELPLEMMLVRMRQQHPVVIRALRAALAGERQPWEGWRTAGTLVAFRPLVETPWMAEGMARREAERAAEQEELQQRIQMYEAPEVQGSDVYDLEDARAVIERLRWATERIEDLDERSRIMEGAAAQAADAQLRAEAAERALIDARAELAGRPAAGDDDEQRRALLERVEVAERAAEAAQRLAGEIAAVEAQAAVERAREELAARLVALEQGGRADEERDAALRAELEVRARETEALREELARVEARAAEAAEEAARLRGDVVEEARAGLEALRAQADELRARSAEAGEEAGHLKARVDALADGDGQARHDLDALRREHQEIRAWLEDVRRERDETRGEVRDAVRAAEEARAALERERADAPTREAAARAAASESEITSFVDGARHELHDLRREADAARNRLEALTHDAADAARRADEARAEAGVARGEAAELRDEAREAQRTAREAAERIDLVDRGAASVLAEVRASGDRIDEVAAVAHAAQRDAGEARAVADHAAAEASAAREQASGIDHVWRDLHAVREGVDGALGRLESIAHELAEARSETGEARSGVERRLAEATAELEAARAEADEARRGVDGVRDELQALHEQAAAARADADAAREAAGGSERTIAELRDEMRVAMAAMQDFKRGFEEARQAAVAARRDAETARVAVEKAGAVHEATSEKFTAVWQQLLGSGPRHAAPAAGEGAQPRPQRAMVSKPKREAPPERPAREGFDDQPHAMAVLDLKGRFRELNPAFTKLVGYKEHEFGKAAWPSALDRGLYKEQAADLERLAAGEIEFAEVRSTYMHGQGLMVPIEGEIQLQRGADGEPESLLLVTDPAGPGGS